MSDATLLHAVLSGSYDPISASATRNILFFMGDALRAMAPQGWDRSRVGAALHQLIQSENVRSCRVHGFGGNAVVYGLTTTPLFAKSSL